MQGLNFANSSCLDIHKKLSPKENLNIPPLKYEFVYKLKEHFKDDEIILLIRKLEIDIAVDLNGYTLNCRPTIFFNAEVPIKINYLGYPGTMGTDYYDYIIADKTVIPKDSRHNFSEKIVYFT